MPNINITVAEKIATNTTPGVVIVCGNSDYTVAFDFDEEWAAETGRVARFLYYKDGLSRYQDVTFTGNTVAVPTLYGVTYVLVGVYAGDLRTTTPAKVLCDRSILCDDPQTALPESAKDLLQAQIGDLVNLETKDKSNLVAAINEAAKSGSGGGLTTSAIILLTDILRHAFYLGDYDSNATITSLAAELAKTGSGSDDSGGDSSGGGDGAIYTITYNLMNTVSSVNTSVVSAGGTFSATLTAEDGYNLGSVTVTMGGVDVTDSVYSDGAISISAVTGNIVISAVSQSASIIMVNGDYTAGGVYYTVSDNKTVEVTKITYLQQEKGFNVLDASQGASLVVFTNPHTTHGNKTTKFSVLAGDIISVSVTADSLNFDTGWCKVGFVTPTDTIWVGDANGLMAPVSGVVAATTYTYEKTVEADRDITEMWVGFRYLGTRDGDTTGDTIKLTFSVKVNGVEVLG